VSRLGFDASNAIAARIILADAVRYGGLPLMWAELWVKHHGSFLRGRNAKERKPGTKPRSDREFES
jgi:hypothetical protein